MIVGYARCSTQEQHLDLQLDALKEAGCIKIFTEKASGAKTDRPELAACLKFLQKGDTLVTWKLDRLGRDLRHLVNTVLDLGSAGIGFKVLTGHGASIDTTTPAGKLIFGVFAALADFERALITERVNAGIKAAKARGVKFGAKPKITPEHLATAQSQRGKKSVRLLAREMGVSKSALYARLHPNIA